MQRCANMKRPIIIAVKIFIICCIFPNHVFAWKLPDTGQIISYTNIFGEDSDYDINTPSFTISGNGTVMDNNTGLMWEIKTSDDSIHDRNNTYTWQQSIGYPSQLNAESFANFNDWRLPTMFELTTIANFDAISPVIDTTYFFNTMLGYYWSSTPSVNTSKAWSKNFNGNGRDNSDAMRNKTETLYVRAVRGNLLTSNFIDNDDSTVTDLATDLMWQQDSDTMNWEAALNYCETLNFAGCSDWRLPNIQELRTIVDYSKSPAVNPLFSTILGSNYVQSSTLDVGGGGVWLLWPIEGYINVGGATVSFSVLCVRPATPCHEVYDADFSANPTKGAAPLAVNFTDQTGGAVNSWNWDFGDDSASNEQNPSHTYNDSGIYTVTLIVAGPAGSDTETKADYIKVTNPIKATPWIPLLLLD